MWQAKKACHSNIQIVGPYRQGLARGNLIGDLKMPTAKIFALRKTMDPIKTELSDSINECVSKALNFLEKNDYSGFSQWRKRISIMALSIEQKNIQ